VRLVAGRREMARSSVGDVHPPLISSVTRHSFDGAASIQQQQRPSCDVTMCPPVTKLRKGLIVGPNGSVYDGMCSNTGRHGYGPSKLISLVDSVKPCTHWRFGDSRHFRRQSPNSATIVASVDRALSAEQTCCVQISLRPSC